MKNHIVQLHRVQDESMIRVRILKLLVQCTVQRDSATKRFNKCLPLQLVFAISSFICARLILTSCFISSIFEYIL